MQNIMGLRRAGVYNYDNFANILRSSDKAKVVNSLDDFTLASLCTETNFKLIKNIDFPKVLSISGNVINFLQLIHTLKNDLEVSPLDVLSVVPHPISIFAILGNLIVNNEIENQGEIMWDIAPDWNLVKYWNNDFMGKPGLPNEYLYICYTDQTKKCKPSVVPTSIVFKNKNDAYKVFGFDPSVVDFDVKSLVYENGYVDFIPQKQVNISW